jgi:hypothetical protein
MFQEFEKPSKNKNTSNVGDQYQLMTHSQETKVQLNMEKFKRKKFQNYEATTKQLIELSVLHKEMAT